MPPQTYSSISNFRAVVHFEERKINPTVCVVGVAGGEFCARRGAVNSEQSVTLSYVVVNAKHKAGGTRWKGVNKSTIWRSRNIHPNIIPMDGYREMNCATLVICGKKCVPDGKEVVLNVEELSWGPNWVEGGWGEC